MKILMYVLNDATRLDRLLDELRDSGIKGCTIFDTNGMGRELARRDDDYAPMFGGLRLLMNPDFKSTKTLMLLLDESKVESVVATIEHVVGDLNETGTGLLFTFTPDFIKGLKL